VSICEEKSVEGDTLDNASFSTTAYRIFRLGMTNFWRNRLLSIATTLVMSLTLMAISIFVILTLIINTTIDKINSKIDLAIYFNEEATEENIQMIKEQVTRMPNVVSVDYIDKEKAYERWQQRPIEERLKQVVTKENNPLPRTLEIKVKNPDQLEPIANYFESEGIKPMVHTTSLNQNREAINRLIKANSFIRKVSIGISFFFILISILIVFNTIRLAIYNRRDEIEIMKLVGASYSFIRWPFILEGMMYGILATIISVLILYFGISFLSPYLSHFLGEIMTEYGGSLISYFDHKLFWIILLQLSTGIIIGSLCSLAAMRKHLQV